MGRVDGSESLRTAAKGKINRLALLNEPSGLSCSMLHVPCGSQVSGQTFSFVYTTSLATACVDEETGSMRYSYKREEQSPVQCIKKRMWHTDSSNLRQREVEKTCSVYSQKWPPTPASPNYLGINYLGEMWPAEQQVWADFNRGSVSSSLSGLWDVFWQDIYFSVPHFS